MKDTTKIEEMAQEIYSLIRSDTMSRAVASLLYGNGWRKQRVGEWVVTAWDGEKFVTIPYDKHEHTDPYCSICRKYALLDGAGFGAASDYCPNCGAKMKGCVK